MNYAMVFILRDSNPCHFNFMLHMIIVFPPENNPLSPAVSHLLFLQTRQSPSLLFSMLTVGQRQKLREVSL